MLKITILTVGNLKERHWRSAQEEYLTRLRPMAKIDLTEIGQSPITASFNAKKAKATEAAHILKGLPANATVIALDENGLGMPSTELAKKLDLFDQETRPICFVVGGTAGLDRVVLDRADMRLSLSRMTFPHEMARVILLEQIYRGLTIVSGKRYHY